jgi:hypothetical protein
MSSSAYRGHMAYEVENDLFRLPHRCASHRKLPQMKDLRIHVDVSAGRATTYQQKTIKKSNVVALALHVGKE